MSAIAPTFLEVVELDEALDFDPPCDLHDEGTCDRPVTWTGRTSCCGYFYLACDVARSAADRYVQAHLVFGMAPTHNPCGFDCVSIAWEPFRKGDR